MKNLVILIAVALMVAGLSGCATTGGMDGSYMAPPANLSVNYQGVGGHHATGVSLQTGAYATAPVLVAPAPVLIPPPVIYLRPIFCPPVPCYGGATQWQIDQARRQQQWAIDQARRQQQWAIDQARRQQQWAIDQAVRRQRCY